MNQRLVSREVWRSVRYSIVMVAMMVVDYGAAWLVHSIYVIPFPTALLYTGAVMMFVGSAFHKSYSYRNRRWGWWGGSLYLVAVVCRAPGVWFRSQAWGQYEKGDWFEIPFTLGKWFCVFLAVRWLFTKNSPWHFAKVLWALLRPPLSWVGRFYSYYWQLYPPGSPCIAGEPAPFLLHYFAWLRKIFLLGRSLYIKS